MSSLCGCLRGRSEAPIPLDAEIEMPCDCQTAIIEGKPENERVMGYPLNGARRPNFDFVTYDNGETYIAVFRAMYRGEVMGRDSNPIPKAVFKDFRVIKEKKNGNMYCIVIDTGGHDLHPFLNKLTKEDLEMLGIQE